MYPKVIALHFILRKYVLPLFSLLLGVQALADSADAEGEEGKSKVFVFPIQAEIDPRMTRQVKLALEEARLQKADYTIIDMNTYGGMVNEADEIRTLILKYEHPIYVFINKNAASAGALISIACDSIYMTDGANIGAATVVNGAGGDAAPDKYQSYMRSMMRSTAEAKGRNPRIAEAMVDQNLEVDSVVQAGQVITFTTSEAIKNGFCEAQVGNIEELLAHAGIQDYTIVNHEITATEKIIAFFLNPFISGILIMVVIGGIYYELQTPGLGFPIAAATIALVLYLVPYYLTGLAANWEIIVFVIGLLLIGLEVFVIPGFGVAGVSGLVLTLGALILVMLNNDAFDFTFVNDRDITRAVLALAGALLGGAVLLFYGGYTLTSSKAFHRLSLQETMTREQGYSSRFIAHDLVGQTAVTRTKLRPSGKVAIGDDIYDASSRGEHIEAGVEVLVIAENGSSLKVKTMKRETV